MIATSFYQKLRTLNPNLKVRPHFNQLLAAGLYLKDGIKRPTHLFGVDQGSIPERMVLDVKQHIIKRGWREVVQILISKRLVKKTEAEVVFNTHFPKRIDPIIIGQEEVDIQREIKKQSDENKDKKGAADYREQNLVLSSDEIHDFKNAIQKEDSIEEASN